jgi:hypothetical protein
MADHDIDLSKDTDATKLQYTQVDAAVPVATATAIPMMMMTLSHQQQPTTFSTSNVMTNQALTTLRQQGFPLGLAQELGNTKATYPIRYWIVDNSGYVIFVCDGIPMLLLQCHHFDLCFFWQSS